MKRLILAASMVLAVALPAAAVAQSPTHRQFGVYRYLYRHARHQFGLEAVGCELKYTCHGQVTAAKVSRSDGVLYRLLHPYVPPPAPVASATPAAPVAPVAPAAPVAAPAPVASSAPASGGYAIPSGIVQCESGGNWSAVNPSSGAGGAYQIMPSTWQAYGGQGQPQNASPAQQSAIASKIWAAQGPGAWSCK